MADNRIVQVGSFQFDASSRRPLFVAQFVDC
jgi:hypothetical protein